VTQQDTMLTNERHFDAAIEVGLSVFLAAPTSTDAELERALEDRGVAPWLAQRVVLFLPVAFGRVLLEGAALSDELADGSVPRKLADDPVWRAASVRSARATREELEAVALRSAEVNAVDAALQRGSRLEELVLSPVTIAAPLDPIEPGDGGIPSPREMFARFLEGHDRTVVEHESMLRSGELEFDAIVYPRSASEHARLQTDFIVAHPALAAPYVIESFAGYATTWRAAIEQTIQKFERASFHVFFAGLLDPKSCAEQVSWEPLLHPGGDFLLCMGGLLVLYANEPARDFSALLDELKVALAEVELSRAVHALRVFVCFDGDVRRASEVLLDNQPWDAGARVLEAHRFPKADTLWGSRLFVLITPA
jgi:hypothetical protein